MEHVRTHSSATTPHELKIGDRAHYCRRSGIHVGEGTIFAVDEDIHPDDPSGKPVKVYHVRLETLAHGQILAWGFANQFRRVSPVWSQPTINESIDELAH